MFGPVDAARAFERRKRYGFISALLISLAMHFILGLGVSGIKPKRISKKDVVSLRLVEGKGARTGIIKKEDKLTGQVIDLPRPQREEAPPENARFLSKYNTRVDREQKARPTPGKKRGQGGKAVASLVREGRPEAERKGDGSGRVEGRAVLTGRSGPLGLLQPGVPHGLSLGYGLGFNGSEQSEGPEGSDDAILDVDREGDTTLVNSRSFKYWDFFQRVKERVRQEWNPVTVYRARDPTGTVYGIRDRLTILGVVLDAEGRLVRLEVVRPSGLPFLDEEALRAFREAAPFPNPPSGLADEKGRIAFHFGFLLDMTSSRTRFFWERR